MSHAVTILITPKKLTYFTDILEMFRILFVWIMTIILTFVLLEYFLNRTVFGMKSTIRSEDKKEFIQSKAEAKLDKIIPISQEDIEPVLEIKNAEKIIVEKAKQDGRANLSKIIDQELGPTSTLEHFFYSPKTFSMYSSMNSIIP